MHTKQELRAWARTIEAKDASQAVCGHLDAWPPLHGVVATFLAMAREIDLAPLAEAPNRLMLVPRVEPDDSLTLHELGTTELVRHPFGFLEPSTASTPFDLDLVDVVLVPGLAFDRHGNRLGNGKGMYDRLLGALPTGVTLVGVATDETLVDRLPTESHDREVQWVATESGVHRVGPELPSSTEMVVAACVDAGIAPAMVRFPEGTKTSRDAARAVGCELGAIAKSLVFLVDDVPVLVLCSGDHRIDERRLATHFGAAVARPAPLDTVREVTGFVAGGTPAVGHAAEMEVVADTTLARYRWVWSAGGTPDTVYPVSLERLMAASGARWADLADRGR